jgi:hypothetical protein
MYNSSFAMMAAFGEKWQAQPTTSPRIIAAFAAKQQQQPQRQVHVTTSGRL